MAKAKLTIRGEREVAIERSITSIGRTPDNIVSLTDDPNISRYHAEIEKRGGEFWLIELGSSNGTTVNGVRLYSEKLLKDGDVIVLGGTSQIVFELEKDALQETPEEEPAEQFSAAPAAPLSASSMPDVAPSAGAPATDSVAAAADLQKVSKTPMLLMIAGGVCGLALVFVVAAVLISIDWSSKCEAKAVITNPENGEVISKEVEIEVRAENTECVRRAIFLLDGKEIASVEDYPYTASLDPREFPALSDGLDHSLEIILEDVEGNPIRQGGILLAFETLATPTPTPAVTETPEVKATPTKKDAKQPPPSDIQEMSRRLLKEFGDVNYKLDPQFLQEVQKRTAEYTQDGYFSRAEPFRDLINVEFHKSNGLPPPLGHLLAMSRSKFNPQKQGAEEGLWRLTDNFLKVNNYKAVCQDESLSDPKQDCAAKATAIYTKAMFSKIFDVSKGELVYAVAAFGMSEGEADKWRESLPADRADFWKAIRDARQREQVVRFFAAGVVSQNPQRFRLKDRPISELYRNFMTQ
jgi:predicted component of type VI protein secretion system